MTFPSRLLFFMVLALFGAILPLAGQNATPDSGGEVLEPPLALVSTVKGAIGPATFKQIDEAIAEADSRNAEVLILRIDTPGGLVTSRVLSSSMQRASPQWPRARI